jgi:hypothetical protein
MECALENLDEPHETQPAHEDPLNGQFDREQLCYVLRVGSEFLRC